MFTTTFSGELINVALRQLGATRIVETRNGIMYKVEFKLSDDLTVTYVFDVTKHDKYYIQRIAPYPISHGDFASADEVIEFVRRDITKFRNAMQSHNFPKFLETAHAMVRFTHAVELMFLERNRCAKSTAARRRSRRSIRNKRASSPRSVSMQLHRTTKNRGTRTLSAAQADSGHVPRFCVKGRASVKMEALAYAFGECSMIALTAVAVSVSGNSS